jgi:hypothetical protein
VPLVGHCVQVGQKQSQVLDKRCCNCVLQIAIATDDSTLILSGRMPAESQALSLATVTSPGDLKILISPCHTANLVFRNAVLQHTCNH